MSSLELTRVNDSDPLGASAGLGSIGFNLSNNVHTLDNLSEHDMPAVQPGSPDQANEKLGPIGVGSRIGHAQDSRSSMLQLEVLVFKLVAVNRLASSSVVVFKVTTLAHKVGDHAVESGILISHSLFSSAKSTEILSGLGDHICSQLHDDAAQRSAVAGLHVKEDAR